MKRNTYKVLAEAYDMVQSATPSFTSQNIAKVIMSSDRPVLVVGEQGAGVTTAVAQAVKRAGAPVMEIRASELTPEDFGLNTDKMQGIQSFEGVIIISELNRAAPDVLNSLFQAALGGVAGKIVFTSDGTQGLDPAVLSRMTVGNLAF